jgi:arylsulfatase A-like enzyme
VHYDYLPPPPFDSMFDPEYRGGMNFGHFASNQAINPRMSKRDLEHLIALYDGEMRHTDTHIGTLLDELAKLGRSEDTLIVLTADHGDEFFEHGQKGHRNSLYREVMHVPLIMSWPGKIVGGQVFDLSVSLVDLMPTVLALFGIELPSESDGRDLSPLLRGEELSGDEPLRYSELTRGDIGTVYAVEGNGWKVLVSLKRKALRVFDLKNDPGERRPLTERNAPQFAEAVVRARRFHSSLAQAAQKLPKAGPVTTQPIDAESLEKLRSLGYIK